MYRTIVVALDGSPREAKVFWTALEIAERSGAALHVCRAATFPPHIPARVCAVPITEVEEAFVAAANRAISFRIASTRQPIAGRHVRLGDPGAVVLDVAAQVHADLVVVGAHGYRGPECTGTTASRILQHATCSVVVVR